MRIKKGLFGGNNQGAQAQSNPTGGLGSMGWNTNQNSSGTGVGGIGTIKFNPGKYLNY